MNLHITLLSYVLSLFIFLNTAFADNCPPPLNDYCDTATELFLNTPIVGTTEGATNSGEFQFYNCNTNTVDVYYKYVIDRNYEAISLNINGWTGSGSIMAQVWGNQSNCDNSGESFYLNERIDDCSMDGKSLIIPLSSIFYTHLTIKIGSLMDDGNDTNGTEEGQFTISIEGLSSSCIRADRCIESLDIMPLGLLITDPMNEQYFEQCISSCLDYAVGENPGQVQSSCDFTNKPTVWYQITVDENAEQLFTSVTTSGNWEPIWSIFKGSDCNNLEIVTTATAPECSSDDSTPSSHQTPILFDEFDNQIPSYWIAISGIGEFDDPTFEVCAFTTADAIVCLGNDENCEPDPSFSLEITEREYGGDLSGPFCQNEKIKVCMSFFYDASEIGVDWLIGIVPTFGSGWDVSKTDFNLNAPTANGSLGTWHDEQSQCAPLIQETVPHLCTYTDEDGRLKLCNSLCESCPCELGMEEGDTLPSGWFWITNAGGEGCENDCSPGEGWGIGTTTVQINFCMDLVTKSFSNKNELLQNSDLQISMQTFSDGVAGCWEDPVGECLIDKKQFGPKWEIANSTNLCLYTEDYINCNAIVNACVSEVTSILIKGLPTGISTSWNLISLNDTTVLNGSNPLELTLPEEGSFILCLTDFEPTCMIGESNLCVNIVAVLEEYMAVNDTLFLTNDNLSFSLIDNDSLYYTQGFKVKNIDNPQSGSLVLNTDGTGIYTPYVSTVDVIDEFTYKLCSTLCPEYCSEANVIINYDNGINAIADIYKDYELKDLLLLQPCEVNIYNTMGQQIADRNSCQEILNQLYQKQIPAGVYFYQLILKDGAVVFGDFIIL